MIKFLKDSYAVHRFRQNCGDESCCSWMEYDGIEFYKEGEEVNEDFINLDLHDDFPDSCLNISILGFSLIIS